MTQVVFSSASILVPPYVVFLKVDRDGNMKNTYTQQILLGACYCLHKFLRGRKKVSLGILMRFYKALKGAIGKMQLKVIFMVWNAYYTVFCHVRDLFN